MSSSLSLAASAPHRIVLTATETSDELGVRAGDTVVLDSDTGRAWLVREITPADPFAVRRAAGAGVLQPVSAPQPQLRSSGRRRAPRGSR